MRIARIDSETIELSLLSSVCCELLQQVVPSADPEGCEAARSRLFPTPTNGCEPEIDEDWRDYVEPELATLFASHLEIIAQDLSAMTVMPPKHPPVAPADGANVEDESLDDDDNEEELDDEEDDYDDDDQFALRIPIKHLEAWIHGLNQARLAIAARYNFTDVELNRPFKLEEGARAFALVQEHFYGDLLGWFVRILEIEEGLDEDEI